MYRRNVCVVIFNEELRFLACQRLGERRYQFVQGGIEKNDIDVVQAAYREAEEEIGLTPEDLYFVGEMLPPSGDPQEFRYTLSSTSNLRSFGYVGQEQRLLLFFATSDTISKVCLLPPKESHAEQEFSHVEWMMIEEIIELCPANKRHIFLSVATLAPPMAKVFLEKHLSP